VTVNQILAHEDLRLRSCATFFERMVAVRVDAKRGEGHSVFWLTETGTADAADEGAETEAATVPDEPPSANGSIYCSPARDVRYKLRVTLAPI
jgi:hypothetical protein